MPRKDAGIPAVRDDLFRACDNALIPTERGTDCEDPGGSISPCCGADVPGKGDPDSEPALNGLNDTDGLLAAAILSFALDVGLEG